MQLFSAISFIPVVAHAGVERAATSTETGAMLSAVAAAASAVAAAAALLVAFSHRRFEARRAFVEFALKRRLECGEALLASLLRRVQLIDEAVYWQGILREPPTEALSAAARSKFPDIRDRLIPSNNEEMNRNLAAANLFFSSTVVTRANVLVSFTNEYMTADVPIPFDRGRAVALLSEVTNALTEELLMRRVLEYQESLFPRRPRRG